MVARRRRHRGMTLVEVMIALLITVVALMGSLAMIGSLILSSSFSRNYTEASVLAQSKLESLVSIPYTSLPTVSVGNEATANALTTTPENLDGLGNTWTSSSTGAEYTRTTSWTPSSDGLRWVVTVTVSWTDGRGTTHNVYASRQKDTQ